MRVWVFFFFFFLRTKNILVGKKKKDTGWDREERKREESEGRGWGGVGSTGEEWPIAECRHRSRHQLYPINPPTKPNQTKLQPSNLLRHTIHVLIDAQAMGIIYIPKQHALYNSQLAQLHLSSSFRLRGYVRYNTPPNPPRGCPVAVACPR